MAVREDLTGKRFGLLTVERFGESVNSNARWHCRCDCGGSCEVLTWNLKKGHTKSCGCIKSPDITGKRFGRLTVLGRSSARQSRGKRTTPLWECRCDCGAITLKAKDTLTNPNESMCAACAAHYAAESARAAAGFVDGTQVTKLRDMKPTAANTSGCRGVYFEKRVNKWRARLTFKRKIMSFGSYTNFEDAVAARRKAELEYFGAYLEEIETSKGAES